MSRDYKPATQQISTSKGSPFFTGLLVGLLLGIGLSVWLTMYLKGGDNPFTDNKVSKPSVKSRVEKSPKEDVSEASVLPPAESTNAVENRFDFYTILPETESAVTDNEVKESALTVTKDNYFLQVGAFQSEADADNMKAKLALQGFEAAVQTATTPEKGVWHRVRVGPLNDITQINKVRGELTANGFNADLIKVRTEMQPD